MIICLGLRSIRGRVSRYAATTAMGVCFLAPAIALADCQPNPTQDFATTTCSGSDAPSLTVASQNSTVIVQTGASVPSITATNTTGGSSYYGQSNSNTITNNGNIANGLTVDSGATSPGNYFGPSTSVNLTVGASGTIGGSTAISLIAETGASYPGTASLVLDNQGTIQSTSGPAITSNNSNAVINSLTNEAGASIGAIQATIGAVNNSGTIAGGSSSAIALTASGNSYLYLGQWQNNGVITANGSAATIAALTGNSILTLQNSGQITNTASGNAVLVQSAQFEQSAITNLAGGTISSAAGVAIAGSSALNITNNGTISGGGGAINVSDTLNLTSTTAISGSVEADNSGGLASTINLSGGGSIAGSLTLGASSPYYAGNALIVDYVGGTNPLSSISGAVNIGGTNNSLSLNIAAGTTLSAPLTLPAAFSTLGLQLALGTPVTLAPGFSSPVGLTLASSQSGEGATLINAATISTVGTVFSYVNYYTQVLVNNTGSITADLTASPSGYAIVSGVINSGSIVANGGNGIDAEVNVTNSGTITASGTAIYDFDGVVSNSGTITSTGGTGLSLYGNEGSPAFNTGTIMGAQYGVQSSGYTVTNSGIIGSATGVGVALNGYAVLDNLAGGVVDGGISPNGFSYNDTVNNAGTINGNVTLGSNDSYIALAGGVLNGNLNLGSNDRFVTDLVNTGAGAYAGITGSVTGAGSDTLVYLVDADTTATLSAPSGPFSVVSYDLANNATLTLSSSTPLTGSNSFAGTGTVNLTANISGNGNAALLDLTAVSVQTNAAGTANPTALQFTSNGNLTVAASGSGTAPVSAVLVGSASAFTNTGTISFDDEVTTPPYSYYGQISAISGGGTITNAGTILIGGAAAIGPASIVVNTGVIQQLAGASDAIGIFDSASVTNSGTIMTGGNAVVFSPFSSFGSANQLTNSGTISSSDGAAITYDPQYSYYQASATITNQASGVISGGTGEAAIALGAYSQITNAGTITGGPGQLAIVLDPGTVTNSGTITGGIGQAATAYNGSVITNSGTITGGSGQAAISLGGGSVITNSGMIDGAAGQFAIALVSGMVTNSGTISGGTGQPAISLGAYSMVSNSGTINGDVDFGTVTNGPSNNIYLANTGGVLNGNLNLGSGGDQLVTSLSTGSTGTYPGITGTVSGSGFETLVYQVTTNSAATLTAPAGVFSATEYDLGNSNATLSLSSATPITGSFSLAGNGTVTITADISGNGAANLLNLTALSTQQNSYGTNSSGLNVTSNGNLTVLASGTGPLPAAAVLVGQAGSFTNNGTISFDNEVTPSGPTYLPTGAIAANYSQTIYNGTITNAGTILIGGAAAIASGDGYGSVVNTGSILQLSGASDGMGIVGISSITNSGTIATGGDAVEFFYADYYNSQVTNSGTISSSDGSAIASSNFYSTVNNQATGIISGGTGQAAIALGAGGIVTNAGVIDAGIGQLAIVLGSGAVINSGTINGSVGQPALILGAGSTVSNSGTITGDVTLGSVANNVSNNTYIAVDGGLLNGNLNLGSGGDRLVTDLTNTGPGTYAGITGAVSGSGFETLVYKITADTAATLSAPIGVFSAIGYDLANNPTLTLSSATPLVASYSFAGTGTVDLSADLSGNGSANLLNLDATSVQTDATGAAVPTAITLINNGNLTVTASGTGAQPAAAVLVGPAGSFTNNGTITFDDEVTPPPSFYSSGQIAAVSGTSSVINNAGTILIGGADAIGSSFPDSTVVNTGSIQQLAGASDGLGIVDAISVTNSGTIATGGNAVEFTGYGAGQSGNNLINSGTISSSDGLAVTLDPLSGYSFGYGTATITNQATGIISGGTGQPAINLGAGSTVSNAGIINGDVIFGGGYYSGQPSFNTFVAIDGGVLNGNLNLGSGGDRLVTDLTNTGPGAYAGITGTVSGSGIEALFYKVTADTTITLSAPSGIFSVIGYDLANNPTLTLSAAAPLSGTYAFAGTGTVNLTADISGNGSGDLLDLSETSVQTDASGKTIPTAIALTSNGTLTVSASGSGAPPAGAVVVGSLGSFTNNGTISFNNAVTPPPYYSYATPTALSGGTVTNNGTIMIGGANAIESAVVVNNGSILQIAGASDGIGIVDTPAVTNYGTIATGGNAVEFSTLASPNLLTNSGTISSAYGIAVTIDPAVYFPATATVINLAGGTISAGTGQPAIALAGGSTVSNAGTINGDVQLGLQGYNYDGSTYVAAGGTLNGNLTFGGGGDTLVVFGNSTGVTGTITSGPLGNNVYAQAYTASASVDLASLTLPAGFQIVGIGAVGAATTINVSGPAGGWNAAVTFLGNGTVINSANVNSAGINGGNYVVLDGTLGGLVGATGGLTFVNSGDLADGVYGTAASFSNSGTIGNTGVAYSGVDLAAAPGQAFAFANSGQIVNGVGFSQAGSTIVPQITVENSGSVQGGFSGAVATDEFSFVNSGTIAANMSPTYYGNYAVNLTTTGTQSGPAVAASSAYATFTNSQTGVINGTIVLDATTPNLAFSNAGQITGDVNLQQSNGNLPDQSSAALVNSGNISGAAYLNAVAANVAITNSGTIGSMSSADAGLYAENVTQGSSALSLTNSGAITGFGATIVSTAGTVAAPATTTIVVANNGSITNTSGGSYTASEYGAAAQQDIGTGLLVVEKAPAGSTTSLAITNFAGATIAATAINAASEGTVIPAGLATAGSSALYAVADMITLVNSGTITGGADTVLPNDGTQALVGGLLVRSEITTIAGGIEIVGNDANATNIITNTATGTITGNTIFYAQNAAFTNYGAINGNVTLGSGTGSFVEGIGATLNGTANAGTGSASLTIDVTGGGLLSQALLTKFTGFADAHLTGSGTITTDGPLTAQTLVLDNAALTLATGQVLQTAGPIALTGGTGSNSFTNYGTVNGAVVDIDTTNGAGGVINIGSTASTSSSFTNAAASAQLNINAGTFTLRQVLSNSGAITVAGGAALVDAAGIANYASGVITVQQGGSISDALVNAGMVINSGTYTADIVNQAGASFITTGAVNAPDYIINAGTFTGNGAVVTTPSFTNAAGGIVNGSFSFGPGGTLLTNQGTIAGNIALGSGANELLLESGSQITGSIAGGSGTNLLAIASSATDASPDQFNLSGVTGFQQSQLISGTVALSGPYTTGSFGVLGGHLIGNSGSVLTAATVSVASGAVFSSAGTVNGNIAVSGTLAPIGTMTVNGNVAFGAGSTALLVIAGDRPSELVTSGSVAISPGSTLTLTGPAALRQGAMLGLIQAGGGISGNFQTVNAPVGGAVVLYGDELELYNPFIAAAGFSGGAAGALAAINALAASGQASPALLAALPALNTAQGAANPAAFARLTPEAYATVTQIGTDDSLQVADTLRSFDDDDKPGIAPRRSGAFTFIEGLGNWTHIDASAALGSSSAHDASGGVLGGAGWRGVHAAISIFGGGIHNQQSIAALGVTNSANTAIIGANAYAGWANFSAEATVAYDGGKADTRRPLPDGNTASSRYRLHSLVADVAMGYNLALGTEWNLRPQVGYTHVTTRRASANEDGSLAFNLAVNPEHRHSDFADASIRLGRQTTATGTLVPWASLGVRTRLGTDNPVASAYLPGSADELFAYGAARAKTVLDIKAGFSYAISPVASFYANYSGATGSGGSGNSVNGGVRVNF